MVAKKKLIIVGLVAVLLIVVLLAWLDIAISSELSLLKPAALVNGSIGISAVVTAKGAATYNNGTEFIEYGQVQYAFKNATAVNFTLSVYQRNPIFRIYLVDAGGACYECINMSQLYSAMYTDLGQAGLLRNGSSFQELSVDNISRIAPNSLVILPSGLLPAQLMPDSGIAPNPGASNLTILNLLGRGDYVLYVGQDFSSIGGGAHIIYQTPINATRALQKADIYTTGDDNYSYGTSFYYNYSTFRFYGGSLYGAAAYVNVTNGTLVVFSRPPSMIWRNPQVAAADLTRAAVSRFWLTNLGTGSYPLNQTNWQSSGALTILTGATSFNASSPTVSTAVNASYALIRLNVSNDVTSQGYEIPYRLLFHPNGTLSIPAVIGYGTVVPLYIKVNPLSSSKSFSIQVDNRNLSFAYAFPISFFNTSLRVEEKYPFGNLTTNEYYIASLVDINNRHYGSAVFFVPNLNVSLTGLNFSSGSFYLSATTNSTPVSHVNYVATFDNEYQETGTVENGSFVYVLPAHTPISYGDHVVRIYALNNVYTYYAYYQAPPSIPPLYIEMGIAGLVVVLLNIILRAPNREQYFIDAPELPAAQKEEVRLPGDQIVNLFETINYHYHWKYMPLTPEEVKSGITTNIRSGNTPIAITLQNTNEVLYKLTNTGKLVNSEDYYMPRKWIGASKHDIEYLIVFRKLRDYLVQHALFFTDLDASSEADMVITTRNRQVPVYIFSRQTGMRKLPLHPGRKAFVVFVNSEAREAFEDELYGKAGKKVEAMRMAIENNAVELIDTEHLDALLY